MWFKGHYGGVITNPALAPGFYWSKAIMSISTQIPTTWNLPLVILGR